MPTTPGCQPLSATTSAAWLACGAQAASAANRMRVSASCRSRLSESSSRAISSARAPDSVSSSSSAASARPHAPGRVDARAEPEAECVLGHLARFDRGDGHQRAQARLLAARERPQTLPDDAPVLVTKRHEIADRR